MYSFVHAIAKNFARVHNCTDFTISNCLFGLCLSVFLSFCRFAFFSFYLRFVCLFVLLYFCLFDFFVSSFCLDTTLIDEGYQVSKVNLCVDITKWHWVSHHHHHHHKSRSRAARAAKNGKKKPWGKTKSSFRVHLLLLCSSMCPWALLGS